MVQPPHIVVGDSLVVSVLAGCARQVRELMISKQIFSVASVNCR